MPTKLKNQHENSNSQVENLNAREVDANPTQTKCALAFDAFNELCCLLDVQYEFLCMQSNIIGSTARKSHGGSDLSESMNLVQAHALRFIKLVRLFVVEAEGLDHSGTHEAAVDEYVAAFLNNARAFNDEIDLQLLSMNHGNIADLSDPYVKDLIATQNYFAKPLLAATEQLIRLSESCISRLIDILLAKTDAENFEAVGLLSESADKMGAQLGTLMEATVSCVKGIQRLIEYGSSAFIEGLSRNAEPSKTSVELELSNTPYLLYSDDQVLKAGYAAMRILSALHSFCYSGNNNDGWFAVNREQLERCFTSEHYSSSRIGNALTILEGLGYIETGEEGRLFRINYGSIAATLITEAVDGLAITTTAAVDAVENNVPSVVATSAMRFARNRLKDRNGRKHKFAGRRSVDYADNLPMAA